MLLAYNFPLKSMFTLILISAKLTANRWNSQSKSEFPLQGNYSLSTLVQFLWARALLAVELFNPLE
jgi:hypothetical protein